MMLDEKTAILIGGAASAVLTPVLMAAWKRSDPPSRTEYTELAPEAIKACKLIERESVVSLVAFFLLLGLSYGWNTSLHKFVVVVAISAIVAIPYLWTVCRCVLAGPQRTKEFVSYFQRKNGVGIKLVSIVGTVSVYTLVVALVVYEVWFR